MAAFANQFRYHLLHQRGGWWIDTNVLCQTSKPPEYDVFFAWESEGMLGSAILRAPKGSELMFRLIQEFETMGTDTDWGLTGPRLLARIVGEEALRGMLTPPRSLSTFESSQNSPRPRAQGKCATEQQPRPSFISEMFRRDSSIDADSPESGSFLDMAYRHYRNRSLDPVFRRLNRLINR